MHDSNNSQPQKIVIAPLPSPVSLPPNLRVAMCTWAYLPICPSLVTHICCQPPSPWESILRLQTQCTSSAVHGPLQGCTHARELNVTTMLWHVSQHTGLPHVIARLPGEGKWIVSSWGPKPATGLRNVRGVSQCQVVGVTGSRGHAQDCQSLDRVKDRVNQQRHACTPTQRHTQQECTHARETPEISSEYSIRRFEQPGCSANLQPTCLSMAVAPSAQPSVQQQQSPPLISWALRDAW